MTTMSNSDISKYVERLESTVKGIKEEIFKISWYMRGGVSAQELFHIYSYEDRTLLSGLIKDNIETIQKTGLPLYSSPHFLINLLAVPGCPKSMASSSGSAVGVLVCPEVVPAVDPVRAIRCLSNSPLTISYPVTWNN